MAYDQIITFIDKDGKELNIVPVALNRDKAFYLLHIFQEKNELNKKFIRNELVMIDKYILTSTFSDTVHFFEELKLFDYGNNQNKYLDIKEYKSTKNLKLKYGGDKDVFVSKSEANAIYKIYNMAFVGYSVASVLENEFRFTPGVLIKLLHKHKFFKK